MPSTAAEVVAGYFDALRRRDLDAMGACWAPDGAEHIAGLLDAVGPDGVRAYFGELFSAFPDFEVTVRQTVAEDDRVAVHWSATGTFVGPAAYVDFGRLRPPARWVMPRLLPTWDGGPVSVERALEEGDEVAGFRVVHLPGHAEPVSGDVRAQLEAAAG